MQPSFEFNLSNCLESLPILKRPRLDDPVQPPPRLPPPPVVQPPPPPPASPRPEPLESPEPPEPPEPPESPPTPPPGSPPEPQTAAQKLLHELINGPSAPAGAEPMATEEAPAPDPQSVTQKMLDALINGPPAAAPAPLPFLMPPAPTLRALPRAPRDDDGRARQPAARWPAARGRRRRRVDAPASARGYWRPARGAGCPWCTSPTRCRLTTRCS